MQVCHVTSVHPPFDTRVFYRECRSLAQAGYSVTLIAPSELERSNVDGVQIVPLPKIEKRYKRPLVWWQIVRQVSQIKPRIVHMHDPELLLICPFLRPAKLVYDCHEPYRETVLLRDWLPRFLRRPLSWLVATLEPFLARQVDAIVVTEESHATPFQRGRQPVTLVYNLPLLHSFELPRCANGKTVIHVGVNSEARGCTTIIEAARLVVQQIPDARFVIIGDFDPPLYQDEMQKLVLSYGLEQNVVLTGRVPHAEVPQWLAKSDVGLIPWQGQDMFPTRVIPTKLFEYMSASIPVVASDLPTIRRFMDGLDCGTLVEPGDPQALAHGIEQLLSHPEEAERKGQNGHRAIVEKYRWETESAKLVTLYRQLTQKG